MGLRINTGEIRSVNFIHWKVDVEKSCVAVVTLRGVECDVMILNRTNYERFRRGSSFEYRGGHYKRSPARLPLPDRGEWHVVVVPGQGGRVEATLAVI